MHPTPFPGHIQTAILVPWLAGRHDECLVHLRWLVGRHHECLVHLPDSESGCGEGLRLDAIKAGYSYMIAISLF